MNRLLLNLLACCALITFFSSCGSAGSTEKKQDYSSLLSSPPFRAITDSIARDPNNVSLLLRRALLLSRSDRHAAATPDYKKAWELTGDESVTFEYASNLLLSSRVEEAVHVLEEGNNRFPDNTEFGRRLAEIYLQNRQYEKSLRLYDIVIARDSSNFEAWYDKGSLLLKMQDTTAALPCLERSFALMPINYSGLALANVYVNRKDPRALHICDLLLSRDSSGLQTDPVYMKGMYYSEINDSEKALKEFDECIRRDWKMTDAYIEKGIIYYEKKDFATALKTFSMAATVSNTDADAYYWMGRCFEATGKTEDAITNYRRAVALDNTLVEAKEALKRLDS